MGEPMQYYVVTEGRANLLDRLQLRDRSTYGLDWMVFYASSAADGIRQWEQFKAGTHLRQAELEDQAATHLASPPRGYAPPWQAEREVVAAEAAERVRAEQGVLRERQADLDAVQQELRQIATSAPVPSRPRQRATSSSKRRRGSTSAKTSKRATAKAPVTTPRRRR